MTDASPCCTPARPPSPPPEPLPAVPDVRADDTAGMVRVPGGPFWMGSEDAEAFLADGEGPVREVTLGPFWIDDTAVTNRQFAAFTNATGWQTDAERFGWSFVFEEHLSRRARRQSRGHAGPAPWWRAVDGAFWRRPEGRGSHVGLRGEHPVVHVSHRDARAFAAWAGKRLPTEAEWERAARGGLARARFPWGDVLEPDGAHRCNVWQGTFPERNTAADGFAGTAPVRSFAPNGLGLYEVAGNVWEWCADGWSATPALNLPTVDPRGPDAATHVIRGGSYLCHASYCTRYRVGARSHTTPDSSSGHVGFRCARDV